MCKTKKYVMKCGNKFVKIHNDKDTYGTFDASIPLLVDTPDEATQFINESAAEWYMLRLNDIIHTAGSTENILVVPATKSDNHLTLLHVYQYNDFSVNGEMCRIDDKLVGDVVKIGGITWRVVDRREEYNNLVKLSFCSEYVIHNFVPFIIPTWDIWADNSLVLKRYPMSYTTSYLNTLCRNMFKPIRDAFRVDMQNIDFCIDSETGSFIHVPTKNQLEGGFGYFSTKETRCCKDYSGCAAMYWTATVCDPVCDKNVVCETDQFDKLKYILGVDVDGAITSNFNPNYVYGFRPCFTVSFSKYSK